jgi:putative transposase
VANRNRLWSLNLALDLYRSINVFVERLWRSVKYEEIYLKAYDTVAEARKSLASYFGFYNSRRPHSSLDRQTPDQAYFTPLPQIAGTRGKTPGKEKDRQNRCNYVTLLKSNFGFCKIYLIEQITSMLHYSPIQNCYQG